MVAPLPPDRARLAAIREALPAVGAGIYLNTATAGPLPSETARVMAEELAREATLGRAHVDDGPETLERVAETRAVIAAILGADLDAVALTRGTAHGLLLACAALPWRPGDRAVVLADGGSSSSWPIAALAGLGVDVAEVDAATPDSDELVAAVTEAVNRGARLVAAPHVLETTGAVLPLGRIAEVGHAAGAAVVVNGSQSVGAIALTVADLDVDLVAFPSERWLLGPAGLGAVWCGPRFRDRLEALAPTGFADPLSARSERRSDPGLGDLEAGAWHRPSIVGLARSCGWLSMHLGLPWAWSRSADLARHVATSLAAVPGVTVLTPSDRLATLVTFRVAGWSAPAALAELGARVFAIAGLVEAFDAIRVSPGARNTDDELDRFVEAVALLAAHSPETLPPRRTLDVLP